MNRNNSKEIEMISADRQPIGKYENLKLFTNHIIQLYKGDRIYISTDGFMNQFGGDAGRKMKSKRFKEMIFEMRNNSMEDQEFILEKQFSAWRGNYEQLDDVCGIGVRI